MDEKIIEISEDNIFELIRSVKKLGAKKVKFRLDPKNKARYTALELELHNALKYCEQEGIQASIDTEYYIPFCYLPEFEYKLDLSKFNGDAKHVKACTFCSLNTICPGILTEYLELNTDKEIFPVFINKSVISRKANPIGSKVAVIKCNEYELEIIKNSLNKAFEHLGGLKSLIQSHQKVLIKPNILDPFEASKAATTHPLIIKAVIELVREITPYVEVGECSGGTDKLATQNSAKKSGIMEVLEQENICFQDFHNVSYTAFDIEDYSVLERTDFANPVVEADLIINIPKLKTHGITFYTGAIKNFFGVIHPDERQYLHKKFPDRTEFSKGVVDIFSFLQKRIKMIHIMDGIVGMEGDEGPSKGEPKKVGIIAVSEDACALDAVCCEIIGYKALAIPTTKNAHERYLGTGDLSQISIMGEKIDDVKILDFKKNSLFPNINKAKNQPGFNQDFTLDPELIQDLCIKCGQCAKNCPVGAIKMDPYPEIDRNLCIRCYCCHETCPYKAYTLKKVPK